MSGRKVKGKARKAGRAGRAGWAGGAGGAGGAGEAEKPKAYYANEGEEVTINGITVKVLGFLNSEYVLSEETINTLFAKETTDYSDEMTQLNKFNLVIEKEKQEMQKEEEHKKNKNKESFLKAMEILKPYGYMAFDGIPLQTFQRLFEDELNFVDPLKSYIAVRMPEAIKFMIEMGLIKSKDDLEDVSLPGDYEKFIENCPHELFMSIVQFIR